MSQMDALLIISQCEDYLFPSRNFSTRERALYYHLLRHTHLEGKASALVAILPLSKALAVAESSVREDIRALHERGCVKIEERSRNGHLVRVFLPVDIPGVVPLGRPPVEIDLESLDYFSNRRFLAALLARESNRCFYCLKAIGPESCELDHVIAQANGRDNSYRNIACSCHECNTTKQEQAAADFVHGLYRRGVLSQPELENRLAALEQLQAGRLIPAQVLLQHAI